jgi:L-seryl-tRNA(Ser) seleniumtransferase
LKDIENRARAWAEATGGMGKVVDGESMIGGGSLPGSTLPTKTVVIGKDGKKTSSLAIKLSQALRQWHTPIVGRVQESALILDPRSVLPEDDVIVCDALKSLGQKAGLY